MKKYLINSESDHTGKFAFLITPQGNVSIKAFRSPYSHASHENAVLAGMRHLEEQGLNKINWETVVRIVEKNRQ